MVKYFLISSSGIVEKSGKQPSFDKLREELNCRWLEHHGFKMSNGEGYGVYMDEEAVFNHNQNNKNIIASFMFAGLKRDIFGIGEKPILVNVIIYKFKDTDKDSGKYKWLNMDISLSEFIDKYNEVL